MKARRRQTIHWEKRRDLLNISDAAVTDTHIYTKRARRAGRQTWSEDGERQEARVVCISSLECLCSFFLSSSSLVSSSHGVKEREDDRRREEGENSRIPRDRWIRPIDSEGCLAVQENDLVVSWFHPRYSFSLSLLFFQLSEILYLDDDD